MDLHPPNAAPRPSFFVVGAQKAGTTTVHDWLASLPDVRLPATKETHFFSDDERYAQGEAWYLSRFQAPPGTIAGEVDPEYLYWEAASMRLARFAPTARLVAVLRDPLRRAWSHYQMTVARGLEPLAFPEALEAEAERLGSGTPHDRMHFSYLDRGRYADHVERLQREMPEAPFHLVAFEALFGAETQAEEVAQLVRFVGSTADPAQLALERRRNAAHTARFGWLAGYLHNERPDEPRWWMRRVPTVWKERVWALLSRVNQRPAAGASSPMPDVPTWVLRWADEQADAVRTRLGLRVPHWTRRTR